MDWSLDAEIDGAWVPLTPDVRVAEPITWGYGLPSADDRVSRIGSLVFVLSSGTAGAGAGTWTPGHPHARAGWEVGCPVRVTWTAAGRSTRKIYRVDKLELVAGPAESPSTRVHAVDWVAVAAETRVGPLLEVQLAQRSDELIASALAAVPADRQPRSSAIATGKSTFPLALQDLTDRTTALAVFARVATSERGRVVVRRGATGEELAFEDRHARPLASTIVAEFAGSHSAITVSRAVADVFNVVSSQVELAHVGAAVEVLWSITAQERAPEIPAGSTLVLRCPYRDPDHESERVGGVEVETTLVAGTHYTCNAESDGSGADLSAAVTASLTAGATQAELVLANTGAVPVWLVQGAVRGKAVRGETTVLLTARDTASIDRYGERPLAIDHAYEQDLTTVQAQADFELAARKDPRTVVQRVSYYAVTAELEAAALDLELSAKVRVVETDAGVSGLDGAVQTAHYVDSLSYSVIDGSLLRCDVALSPAGAQDGVWLLGVDGAHELGVSTRIGSA